MTQFQLVCAAVFVVGALLVYRHALVACLRGLFGGGGSSPVVSPRNAEAPVAQPSIAVSLVNDILSVTQLRDRLAAEECPEGVEACTVLLRVIVEYQSPSKGVV